MSLLFEGTVFSLSDDGLHIDELEDFLLHNEFIKAYDIPEMLVSNALSFVLRLDQKWSLAGSILRAKNCFTCASYVSDALGLGRLNHPRAVLDKVRQWESISMRVLIDRVIIQRAKSIPALEVDQKVYFQVYDLDCQKAVGNNTVVLYFKRSTNGKSSNYILAFREGDKFYVSDAAVRDAILPDDIIEQVRVDGKSSR